MGSMAQTGLLLVPSDALGHTWALPGALGGGLGLPPPTGPRRPQNSRLEILDPLPSPAFPPPFMACTAAPKFNDDDGSARFETARTLRDFGLQSRAGGASPSVRSGIYLGRKASTVAASSGASALVEWRWMQIANPEFLSAMKTHVMTHIKGGTNWQTLAPTAEEQRWVEQKVGHIFEKPDVLRARADVHATEGPRFSILRCAALRSSLLRPLSIRSQPLRPSCSDLSVQRYSMDWLRDFSLDCIVTELLEQDIDAFFDPDEDTSGVRGAGETSSPTISARASDMNKFVRAACSWIPSLRGLSVDPEERESPYTSEQLIDVCSYVLNAAPGTTTKQLHAELSKCLPEGSLLESDLEIAVSKVRKRDLLNHPCTTASAAGAAAGAAAARSAAEEAAAANEEAGAAGAAAGAAAAAELLAEVATAPPATAGSSVTHEVRRPHTHSAHHRSLTRPA